MKEKCESCLNSRIEVSENGYHYVCCLPALRATECTVGLVNYYVSAEVSNGE